MPKAIRGTSKNKAADEAPKKKAAKAPAVSAPKAKAKAKAKPEAPSKSTTTVAKASPTKKVAKASKASVPASGAAVEAADAPATTPARKKGHKEHALVVVESPAKARTIKKYLGAAYTVKASVGHVKDLPKSKMGVDVEHSFQPEYVVMDGKKKVLSDIRKSAADADVVYLAPDPDREGEAIAWHIWEEIKDANANVKRVLFNEITKKGITTALEHPTILDEKKYESQQARRILDRLVGYQISPVLWNKVKRGLSAGRVQSVAVRMVVEREREIAAFKPEEYWTIECRCLGPTPPPFAARLFRWKGEKVEIKDGTTATAIADGIRVASARVEKVERKERRKHPLPPFITSRLQQEAARKLRFTAKKTMALAQRLYEGLDLGEEGPVGLITYMRTDSVRLADDAVTEVRAHILERYGADYLPATPATYKSAKQAQGAHEAIRPTSTKYDPETVRRLLEGSKESDRDRDEYLKLYTLIWNRFVACQMNPAIYDQTTVDVSAGEGTLRATGQVMKFAGYTAVYLDSAEETGEAEAEDGGALPPLNEGDAVALHEVKPEQHFTQPPPRFSEASLVKALEENGIGRPSTYAAILSTIQDRGYVEKREARFYPTELGSLVNDLLVVSFPQIVNTDFTAQMEDRLDKVEEGNESWIKLLDEFYGPFKTDLAKAQVEMRDVKREEIPTEHVCEKCGKPMVIKWGRNGSFLACSGYPDCKNTKEFRRRADGSIEIVAEQTTDEKCSTCGADMVVRRGRFGSFLACSRYPECKTTKPISLGVKCGKSGCDGYLTEKRSRRGKVFFGCSNYSKTGCDYVLWDRPVPVPCPQCAATFVVRKVNRKGSKLRCITPDCGWELEEQVQEQEPAA
jgi:DNA topoisomerase-1